jgi:hypothetical protein
MLRGDLGSSNDNSIKFDQFSGSMGNVTRRFKFEY